MSLNSILDPVLNPILSLSPFWGILMISILVSVLMTFIYKWMTDQHMMKSLKEDIKKSQKEMKALRDDPKKMMEVQKKAMDTNMKYMMHSMKPTFVTIIPILLIFGWLNANLAFMPIMPGEEFTTSAIFAEGVDREVELVVPEGFELFDNGTRGIVDGTATWMLVAPTDLKNGEGDEYVFEYVYDGESEFKDVIITTKQRYAPVKKIIKNKELKTITIDNKPVKIMNLFGWKVGWLGTYIIFSIIFSMGLRKLLKIH